MSSLVERLKRESAIAARLDEAARLRKRRGSSRSYVTVVPPAPLVRPFQAAPAAAPPAPPVEIEFIEDELPHTDHREDLELFVHGPFDAWVLEPNTISIFETFADRETMRVTYIADDGDTKERIALQPPEEDLDAYPAEKWRIEEKFGDKFYRLAYTDPYHPFRKLVEFLRRRIQETTVLPCRACSPFFELCANQWAKGPFEIGGMFASRTEELARMGHQFPCTCQLDVISRILAITCRLFDALIKG